MNISSLIIMIFVFHNFKSIALMLHGVVIPIKLSLRFYSPSEKCSRSMGKCGELNQNEAKALFHSQILQNLAFDAVWGRRNVKLENYNKRNQCGKARDSRSAVRFSSLGRTARKTSEAVKRSTYRVIAMITKNCSVFREHRIKNCLHDK